MSNLSRMSSVLCTSYLRKTSQRKRTTTRNANRHRKQYIINVYLDQIEIQLICIACSKRYSVVEMIYRLLTSLQFLDFCSAYTRSSSNDKTIVGKEIEISSTSSLTIKTFVFDQIILNKTLTSITRHFSFHQSKWDRLRENFHPIIIDERHLWMLEKEEREREEEKTIFFDQKKLFCNSFFFIFSISY